MIFFNKVIDDLKQRLTNRRELVEPLENAAWTYGISSTHLNDILEYWHTKYNWSERQALLNKYLQYKTNIQGNLFGSSVIISLFTFINTIEDLIGRNAALRFVSFLFSTIFAISYLHITRTFLNLLLSCDDKD